MVSHSRATVRKWVSISGAEGVREDLPDRPAEVGVVREWFVQVLPQHDDGALVDVREPPVRVDRVEGVGDPVEQRHAPPRLRLGPPAFADVAVVDREARVRRIGVGLDPLATRLEVRLELDGALAAHGLAVAAVEFRADGVRKGVPHGPAEHLLARHRTAGPDLHAPEGAIVDVREPPVPVHRHVRVGDALEDRLAPPARLGQRLLSSFALAHSPTSLIATTTAASLPWCSPS